VINTVIVCLEPLPTSLLHSPQDFPHWEVPGVRKRKLTHFISSGPRFEVSEIVSKYATLNAVVSSFVLGKTAHPTLLLWLWRDRLNTLVDVEDVDDCAWHDEGTIASDGSDQPPNTSSDLPPLS
jgi:hypothetical protein